MVGFTAKLSHDHKMSEIGEHLKLLVEWASGSCKLVSFLLAGVLIMAVKAEVWFPEASRVFSSCLEYLVAKSDFCFGLWCGGCKLSRPSIPDRPSKAPAE